MEGFPEIGEFYRISIIDEEYRYKNKTIITKALKKSN